MSTKSLGSSGSEPGGRFLQRTTGVPRAWVSLARWKTGLGRFDYLMDERPFADMHPDETLKGPSEPFTRLGLWAHMATLIEVFSPIQELNWRAANSEGLHPDQIEQDTYKVAQLLDTWKRELP